MANANKEYLKKPRLRRKSPDKTNPIADFIREKRLERNLTQADLSREAGVGLEQLRRIERGSMMVSFSVYQRILLALGHELVPATYGTLWT